MIILFILKKMCLQEEDALAEKTSPTTTINEKRKTKNFYCR